MKRVRVRQRTGAGGFTLLEAMLVLGLASSVVLIFALGLITVVKTDGQSKAQQELSSVLTTFAEGLRRTEFLECCPVGPDCLNGAADPAAAWMDNFASLLPSDSELAEAMASAESYNIVDVTYWEPGDFSDPAVPVPGSFGASCVPGVGVVKLSIDVEYPGESESGEVVVRNQEAS